MRNYSDAVLMLQYSRKAESTGRLATDASPDVYKLTPDIYQTWNNQEFPKNTLRAKSVTQNRGLINALIEPGYILLAISIVLLLVTTWLHTVCRGLRLVEAPSVDKRNGRVCQSNCPVKMWNVK